MTLAATYQRQTKRLTRKLRNLEAKRLRAAQRQLELVELGKTLIKVETDSETEKNEDGTPKKVVSYELPPVVEAPTFNNPPHLAFAGMKRYRHQFMTGKGRPGNKELHAEAIVEDASRTFTKECDKAMSVPAVNGEPLTQE